VEKFGMERRWRRRNSLVSTPPEKRKQSDHGYRAICAVAVTTWHPCSDVFPSRVLAIKRVLHCYNRG
jgi:hypothetical protein